MKERRENCVPVLPGDGRRPAAPEQGRGRSVPRGQPHRMEALESRGHLHCLQQSARADSKRAGEQSRYYAGKTAC